jgi:hypothetical protein
MNENASGTNKAILTEDDRLKYEIADELGLIDKVQNGGWRSLSARESGRIGGMMAKRKKDARTPNQEE